MLDPCPLGQVEEARGSLKQWSALLINSSLSTGVLPAPLEAAIIRLLLKNPTLDPAELGNYRPVSIVPFAQAGGGQATPTIPGGNELS